MSTAKPLSEVLSRETLKGLVVPGDVINNDDPDRLMRVQVRVPLLHREILDEDLPWARPLLTFAATGMSGAAGSIRVPQIGSKVALQFLDDSLYNPLYLGDIADTNTVPQELLADYPNAYGWIDAAGNLLFVNTTTGIVKFVHVTGAKLEITQAGAINIAAATTVSINGQSNISILSAAEVKIHAGPKVDIRAARIDLNQSTSGDGPEAITARTRPASREVAGRTKA
jgi:hypothetical protein